MKRRTVTGALVGAVLAAVRRTAGAVERDGARKRPDGDVATPGGKDGARSARGQATRGKQSASGGNGPGKPDLHRGQSAAKAASRPSIVLVLLDDLAITDWQALPETRRLGGTFFPNCFATTPQCGPSRASILTGMYAHNHGVLENRMDAGAWKAYRKKGLDKRSLGLAMQRSGYTTALMGKFLNGYESKTRPAGWDDWRAATGGKYYSPRINENGRLVDYGAGDYLTDIIRDRALEFIDRTPTRNPLFLYWAPFAPHGPSTPPTRDLGAYAGVQVERDPGLNEADNSDKPKRQRKRPLLDLAEVDASEESRLETLASVDLAVMAIVDKLKQTGRWANTIMMVVSDNGYTRGQHRMMTKGAPYDAAARTPALVVGPGFKNPIDRRLITNLDISYTIAKLGHAEMADADGRDIRSVERAMVLLEGWVGEPWQAVRTRESLYAAYKTGEEEYYDYRTDPYELDNKLANWKRHTPSLPKGTHERTRALLERYGRCAGKTCP